MKVHDLGAHEKAKLLVVGMLLCWICAVLYAILMIGVR
jgi:hypothetical protein